MKTERNILIAFFLNFTFSVFEFVGGFVSGSTAILSDAIHDAGDAFSIGIAYFLEKKSKHRPDQAYTYGYMRYSVVGSFITTLILLMGSFAMICNAITNILTPTRIHYDTMILFAMVGIIVNIGGVYFTRGKGSLNQKAVNLHMLEDVLGWVVVLVGAIVMRFTDFALLDPLMSLGVSVFILIQAIQNMKEVLALFLEKAPKEIDIEELTRHLCRIDGVTDVHHIHLWSMDGQNNYATMHVVANRDPHEIKEEVRRELKEHGIGHVTIETETEFESCHVRQCTPMHSAHVSCGCHHHH